MNMTAAAPTTPARRSGAQPGNEHFANDASYESVRRLLYRLAVRCHARVQAMGLGMTFDDVHQEMNLTYVLARRTWNPEAGARFTTYLTTCCYRNFNARIAKPERERRELGMVNMTDMRPRGTAWADDDETDLMEVYGEDQTQVEVPMILFSGLLDDNACGDSELPEQIHGDPMEILQRKQDAMRGLRSIAELTPVAREYAIALVRAAREGDELPNMNIMGDRHQLTKGGIARMRHELKVKFGLK